MYVSRINEYEQHLLPEMELKRQNLQVSVDKWTSHNCASLLQTTNEQIHQQQNSRQLHKGFVLFPSSDMQNLWNFCKSI